MIIVKRNIVEVVFVALLVLFSSCKKESKSFDENLLITPELEGSYRNLDELGIRLFLPKEFTSLNEKDLEDIINLIPDEQRKKDFRRSLEVQSFVKHPTYNYMSNDHGAMLTIQSIPHMPFSKNEAGRVLYYVNTRYDKIERSYDIEIEKIKSTFKGTRDMNVMNAVYKLHDSKNLVNASETFESVYVISGRKKSLLIILHVPVEPDFDDYIKKIKL